ncbi:phosphotransferase family protein [Pseudonocardia hispaniensis]|uniref:Phosphotransferase family protein n=1 Tax=Pseudonocardia hispaniensis TaxID=904933 RepID=A0ABW1IYM4_9PSEU
MTGTLTGLDLPRLQKFFDDQVPGAGQLRAELLSGGRSNLTYLLTDGRCSWVLRRPPLGGLTPSAHDMGREYRVVAALRDTGVPVAHAVAQCDDPSVIGTPFAVVTYVSGRVLRTQADLDAFGDADVIRCATALIDTLVALHAIDPNAIGLGDFGRAKGYLGRQVRRWYDQWTRVATRDMPDIETLHSRLAASIPQESEARIVHGDFRVDNTILDPADIGTVRAVVDWEMATLGDPMADLALHLVYRDPAFDPVLGGGGAAATSPRMPAADDLVQRYAVASGRRVANLPFALALGYFKIAVIAEGIHARHLAGHTVGTGFDSVGEAVPALAAAGLAALREPGSC